LVSAPAYEIPGAPVFGFEEVPLAVLVTDIGAGAGALCVLLTALILISRRRLRAGTLPL
jgi:hypothetical protein